MFVSHSSNSHLWLASDCGKCFFDLHGTNARKGQNGLKVVQRSVCALLFGRRGSRFEFGIDTQSVNALAFFAIVFDLHGANIRRGAWPRNRFFDCLQTVGHLRTTKDATSGHHKRHFLSK